MMKKPRNLCLLILLISIFNVTSAWGGTGEKVLLKDVQVLTLNQGHFTNGRRSAGVPQIKCVGGSAGCSSFVPQVVQCYNKGFDGTDYQWECKTDMDNGYRFGQIAVTCEGYDYPDDPYVLKGSCGLEYTMDFTKEGYSQKSQSQQSSSYGWNIPSDHPKAKSFFSIETIVLGAGACLLVYAIYRTCIAPTDRTDQRSTWDSDYPGGGPDAGSRRSNAPPPPGFRSDYGASGGDSCGAGTSSRSSGAGTGMGGGGFWTGAATGGLLGYMFGNSRNAGYNTGYNSGFAAPRTSGWGGSSWGGSGGGFGGGGFGGGGASTSSGSRTTSGFGGTRRR